MIIREATDADFLRIWPIFHKIVQAGDTYSIPTDTNRAKAKDIWLGQPLKTYVAEENQELLGTYKLSINHAGGEDHVCNCGYMVSPQARGRGIATKMCKHSQKMALELSFKAMQFNMVVASNAGAVRLWQSLGFDIVGTLPRAFRHPALGFVDAYVMYKWLAD